MKILRSLLLLVALFPAVALAERPCTLAVDCEASTNKLVRVTSVIDMSAGGENVVAPVATIPAGAIIIEMAVITTEEADGDFTTGFDVGVEGQDNRYFSGYPDVTTLGSINFLSLDGTVKVDYLTEDQELIATWSNLNNATTGSVTVIIVYAR